MHLSLNLLCLYLFVTFSSSLILDKIFLLKVQLDWIWVNFIPEAFEYTLGYKRPIHPIKEGELELENCCLFHLVLVCLSLKSVWFNFLTMLTLFGGRGQNRMFFGTVCFLLRSHEWPSLPFSVRESKLFVCSSVFVPCSMYQRWSTVQQKRGSGAAKKLIYTAAFDCPHVLHLIMDHKPSAALSRPNRTYV